MHTRAISTFYVVCTITIIICFLQFKQELQPYKTELFFALKISLFILTAQSAYLSFRFFQDANKFGILHRAKIRSAAQDYICLKGEVVPYNNQQTTSPLSNEECAWYHYKIYHTTKTRQSTATVLIEENISSSTFCLQGETGSCIILPKGLTALLKPRTWYGYNKYPKTPPSRLACISHGPYSYIEYFLPFNTTIYAFGMFSTKDGINYLSQEALPKGLQFTIALQPPEKISSNYKRYSIIYAVVGFSSLVMGLLL